MGGEKLAWKIHHFRWIDKNGKFQRVNIRETTTSEDRNGLQESLNHSSIMQKSTIKERLKRGFIQIGYRLTLMQASSITIGGKVEWARNVMIDC